MALIVYIRETGWQGTERVTEPLLRLVGVIVEESAVSDLNHDFRDLAVKYFDKVPASFEFKGHDLYHGEGFWSEVPPTKRLEAFEDAVLAIERLGLKVGFSSIDKERLGIEYKGLGVDDAYFIALQFLVEKIDALERVDRSYACPKMILADGAGKTEKQKQRAIRMVSDLKESGVGVFGSRTSRPRTAEEDEKLASEIRGGLPSLWLLTQLADPC